MPPHRVSKAIALMSGGLDSTLAARLVREQGVDVVGLHLFSPFGCRENVEEAAKSAGVPLLIREKGEAYLDLLKNPRYGYGRAMNPCIDCRIFMFTLAEVVMKDEGADFVVTGEVLGQRPMSQQRHSMELIDRKSPIKGLIVRPLSAHSFAPSIPEVKGWVDRKKFLRIAGRSRKEQFALAERMGIKEYGTPGGGCLLTETSFSSRLRDFFEFATHTTPAERMAQAELLRLGRHFRLSEKFKVILARNQKENIAIDALWKRANAMFFSPKNFDGPSAVSFGEVGEAERDFVGSLIARYGKGKELPQKFIAYQSETPPGQGDFVVHRVITEEELEALRI